MPSAYLLVYHSDGANRRILISTKNVLGRRIGGNAITQQGRDCTIQLGNPAVATNVVVWNNAGQNAVPGGAKGQVETWLAAAQREFFEETGIDFREAQVRQAHQVVANQNPTQTWFRGNGVVLQNANPRPQYYCAYYKIAQDAADNLLQSITQNIANNTPADDEIHDVAWRATNAAGFQAMSANLDDATIRPDQNAQPAADNANWRAYYVHLVANSQNRRLNVRNAAGQQCTFAQYYTGRLAGSFDWFQTIVANLP